MATCHGQRGAPSQKDIQLECVAKLKTKLGEFTFLVMHILCQIYVHIAIRHDNLWHGESAGHTWAPDLVIPHFDRACNLRLQLIQSPHVLGSFLNTAL